MFLRLLCLLMLLNIFEAKHVVTKRGGNAYGDEPVVPSGEAPKGAPAGPPPAPAPEQPAAIVPQVPPAEEPKVVESGYRA